MSNLPFTQLANFQEKQKEAWYRLMTPECKYLLYGGAAGGGKSYFLRWTAIGLAMYYYGKYGIEKLPIGLFSEDYPSLRDRQVTKISREFPSWLGTLKETQRDGLGFYLSPEYGSGVIMLRNLDDPSKYASVEFAAIIVEELTKNSYSTFEDLRTRLRFPGVEDRKFVGGTNPGQVGHGWVKRLWVKPDESNPDAEQDRCFFVQSLFTDNSYNPEDYKQQLAAIRDPQKRKALMEGSWDIFAGQYFTEWNDQKHVINPYIPSTNNLIAGGMDWGRTAPFAFHLAEITKVKHEGVAFHRSKIFCEVYGTEKTPHEWAEKIHEQLKFFNLTIGDISWIQGDPAMFTKGNDNSLSIADQFLRDSIRMRPASNDRIGGWEVLHNWLTIAPDGLPYLQVTANCINLIRTLPELVHDENRIEDVDTEGEDHSPDAIRYLHKAVKWIDGKLGGVGRTGEPPKRREAAKIDPITGKQVSIDLGKFAQTRRRLYYKR